MKGSITSVAKLSTGLAGLDAVLNGGLPRERVHLLVGAPGSGKTTLALMFLMEGARRGERCLLLSNCETPAELEAMAGSHGWSLEGIRFDSWGSQGATPDADYTLFPADEVEAGESLDVILRAVEEFRPDRLVLETLSSLRVLSRDPAFYRRHLDSLRRFLGERSCTTLLTDEEIEEDRYTASLVNSVIGIEQVISGYGPDHRRLRVVKMRGSPIRGGYHDFSIETGRVTVYPRLERVSHPSSQPEHATVSSGVSRLDMLAGGGIDRGTSTLLLGPAGAGKSSLATLYACAGAERGERSLIYLFDESTRSYQQRSRSIGLAIDEPVDKGMIRLKHLNPAEVTAGQLSHLIAAQIEDQGVQIVVIDSLNGYLQAMPDRSMIWLHLRQLLSYLAQRQIVTLLVMSQHGLISSTMNTPVDISFIADNVMLLRYFEAGGEMRRAIAMVKKRSGPHERTIRELSMDSLGVHVGEPLVDFTGVLSGQPVFTGDGASLSRLHDSERTY